MQKNVAMNPYYYLFYKLNRFLNKKENNEWGVIYAISGLLMLNFIYIYIKFFNITKENSEGLYKTILIVITILLFIINWILFLDKKRVQKIMNLYKNESKINRRLGSFLVVFYVILTVALILFI